MKRLNKLISSAVLVCFIFNTAVQDYAFGLGPGTISPGDGGSLRAGSAHVMEEVYNVANSRMLSGKDAGDIRFDDVKVPFKGVIPETPGIDFNISQIDLGIRDIGQAYDHFRKTGAGFMTYIDGVKIGELPVESPQEGVQRIWMAKPDIKTSGRVDLSVSRYFADSWHDIRNNDAWFYVDSEQGSFYTSIGWMLFHRLNASKNRLTDAAALWFLNSYMHGPETRYNNDNLRNRLEGIFSENGIKNGLANGFEKLITDQAYRQEVINIALAMNAAYYDKREGTDRKASDGIAGAMAVKDVRRSIGALNVNAIQQILNRLDALAVELERGGEAGMIAIHSIRSIAAKYYIIYPDIAAKAYIIFLEAGIDVDYMRSKLLEMRADIKDEVLLVDLDVALDIAARLYTHKKTGPASAAVGAMSSRSNADVSTFRKLMKFLNIYHIDIDGYVDREQAKMTASDNDAVNGMLRAAGLSDDCIKLVEDRVVLCEKPAEMARPSWDQIVGVPGQSRVGALLYRRNASSGLKTLFPRDRFYSANTNYNGDLVHEVVEMLLREKAGLPEVQAHRIAMTVRAHYLNTGRVELPGYAAAYAKATILPTRDSVLTDMLNRRGQEAQEAVIAFTGKAAAPVLAGAMSAEEQAAEKTNLPLDELVPEMRTIAEAVINNDHARELKITREASEDGMAFEITIPHPYKGRTHIIIIAELLESGNVSWHYAPVYAGIKGLVYTNVTTAENARKELNTMLNYDPVVRGWSELAQESRYMPYEIKSAFDLLVSNEHIRNIGPEVVIPGRVGSATILVKNPKNENEFINIDISKDGDECVVSAHYRSRWMGIRMFDRYFKTRGDVGDAEGPVSAVEGLLLYRSIKTALAKWTVAREKLIDEKRREASKIAEAMKEPTDETDSKNSSDTIAGAMAETSLTVRTSPYFIGMSMGGTKLYAVLYKRSDSGRPVAVDSTSCTWKDAFGLASATDVADPAKVSPDAIAARIADTVKALAAKNRIKIRDLNNIGCTSPGPVDSERGTLGWDWKTHNLPFSKYEFTSKLSALLGSPYVEIRHDAHSGLEGEIGLGLLSEVDSGYYVIQGTGLGGSLSKRKVYSKDIPELTEPGHHIVRGVDGHYRFIQKRGTLHPYEVVERPDPAKAHQITEDRVAAIKKAEKIKDGDFIWVKSGERDMEDVVSGGALEAMLKDKVLLLFRCGGKLSDYQKFNTPADVSELALNGTKAQQEAARRIIKYLADAMGRALACLAAASYGTDWQLERIVIGSTVGERLGIDSKGVMLIDAAGGRDYYFGAISNSMYMELIIKYGVPLEFARTMLGQVFRSTITQDERETAGFDRYGLPALKLKTRSASRVAGAMAQNGTGADTEVPTIDYVQAPREFDNLVALLGWVATVAPTKGPAAVPGELPVAETQAIWNSVNLLESEKTEIILPSRVNPAGDTIGQSFRLTDAFQRTIDAIQKRNPKGSLKTPQYGSKEDLEKILRGGDSSVKRVIVVEAELEYEVAELLHTSPELFKGVRLYNMALPSYYGNKYMTKNEQSVCQARVFTIALLVRLYDKDKPFVRMLLESMLAGRLPEGVDLSTYIDIIGKTDEELSTTDRINYFLHKAVSMVETLGKQLRLLERFVWTAA